MPASACCWDHTGQEKPKPPGWWRNVNSSLALLLFPGSKREAGLSPQVLPHLQLGAETQPPPQKNPGKPGLLIEPGHSSHRGTERARGSPEDTQQSCPEPRPAPASCSPASSFLLRLPSFNPSFIPVISSDRDLDQVKEAFLPHSCQLATLSV